MDNQTGTIFERMMVQENREQFLIDRVKHFEREVEVYLKLCEYIISERCTADIQRLIDGDYTWPIARKSLIRKSGTTKRRAVYVYPDDQRFLLMYVAWFLHGFDSMFAESLCSFRIEARTTQIFRTILHERLASTKWAVKTDISSYFNSIDPEILVGVLRKRLGAQEPELVDFLAELLLRGEYEFHGQVEQGSLGAIAGAAVSNFFGNIYLMDLDERMEARGNFYVRYSDDICIFVESEEEAQELLEEITQALAEKKLALNLSKTEIHAPSDSFALLGFQLRGQQIDVADFTLKKARRKMRLRAKKYNRLVDQGKITREQATQYMLRFVKRFFFGEDESALNWTMWFFGTITRVDSLIGLDHYIQDMIRYVATGKLGKARYRMTHEQMRAMGYESLANAYWNSVHERRGFYIAKRLAAKN